MAQPIGPNRFADVVRTEEKGSDVNLATWLLLDGADNLYELAIVISNEADLMDAVQQAAKRFGQVWVVNPNVLYSNALKRAATRYLPLPAAMLAAAQFPDPVQLGKGRIAKPKSW